MRTWSPTLKTELAGAEISRCHLIEATNRLGEVVRLNDFGSDLVSNGDVFSRAPGFHVTSLVYRQGGNPPAADVVLPVSTDGPIYDEHVRRGVWRAAEMTLYVAKTDDPDDREVLITGYFGKVAFSDQLAGTIEVITRGDALNDIVLPRVQPRCRHIFGSTGCGFDVSTVALTAEVATVTNNSKFTITVTNPSALDFNYGAAKMTSGDSSGASADIRKWTVGTSLVELWQPMPLDIAVGDTLQIHAGCARTRAACAAYSNIDHYGGYDHTPGENYVSS